MTDTPRTPPRRRTLILGGLIAILALIGVI